MKGNFKVSPETRQELLEHFMQHGYAPSMERCAALGLSPKYAANLAAASGLHRHKNNGAKTSTRSAKDPRWARAIANGAVTV